MVRSSSFLFTDELDFDNLSKKKQFLLPSRLEEFLSDPISLQVWQGAGVVKGGRVLIGATKPSESAPGTIRGDLAIDVGRYFLQFLKKTKDTSHLIPFSLF